MAKKKNSKGKQIAILGYPPSEERVSDYQSQLQRGGGLSSSCLLTFRKNSKGKSSRTPWRMSGQGRGEN